MDIVFETHSLSVDNEEGFATGWNDGELSDEGRRLAAELGKRHRANPPWAVFSSDLGRAVQTVEIAFGDTGIPIAFDRRLRECDYGQMTGAPVARLDPERPHRVRTPFPSGESYADVVERTRSFLADLAHRQPSDARVVIVGHSATKWALDFLILGVPLETSVAVPFGWQPGWAYVFA